MEPRDPIPRSLRVASELAWRSLVVVAVIVLLAFVFARLRIVFLPIVIAILLATILAPLAARLVARSVPRAVAALASLLALLVVVGGMVAVIVPQVATELGDVDVSLDDGVDRLTELVVAAPFGVDQADVERYRQRAVEQLGSQGRLVLGGLLGGAFLLAEIVIGMLLALVLLFFFLKDGREMWEWVVRLFPQRSRADVSAIGSISWETLGGYFRGIVVIAFADAVALAVVLLVLDVPLVLPLAALTFLGAFFPIVGAFVAGFVATMVALALNGVTTALIVLGAVILIQQVEGDVLQPVVMGRAVALHPVAVLLAVAAGAVVWGVAGAFLAVPLVAIVAKSAAHLRPG